MGAGSSNNPNNLILQQFNAYFYNLINNNHNFGGIGGNGNFFNPNNMYFNNNRNNVNNMGNMNNFNVMNNMKKCE